MTDEQTATINMGEATAQVMNDNKNEWKTVKAIDDKVTALKKSVKQLKKLGDSQKAGTKGHAEDKKNKRKEMGEQSLVVCQTLAAYAQDKDNEVLLGEIDFEISDFIRGKDTDAAQRSKLVHKRADEHKADLAADYGITQTDLDALDLAINDFEAVIAAPRTAKANTKAATTAIKKEFKNFDKILVGLDGLMVRFKKPNVDFYNAYLNARTIIDSGRKTSIEGKITDLIIGTFIKGAKVVISNADGSFEILSTKIGGYRFMSLTVGNYTVTVSKKGYKDFVKTNVAVKDGEMVKLDVGMEKI